MIHVVQTTLDGCAVLEPQGELVASTVPVFRQALADVGPSGDLVIDLSLVDFIDSAGLGSLVGGIRRMKDGGIRVAVACDNPSLAHLLHTHGVDLLAPVAQSPQDAIAEARSLSSSS